MFLCLSGEKAINSDLNGYFNFSFSLHEPLDFCGMTLFLIDDFADQLFRIAFCSFI